MPTQTPGRVGNYKQTGQRPSKEAEYSTLPYVVWRAKRRAEAAVGESGLEAVEAGRGPGGMDVPKACEGRCVLERTF